MTSIESGESREDKRVDPRLSALAKAQSRAETRAEWVPAALAQLDAQLSRHTLLNSDGQFRLARWPATEERFYLRLLTHTEEKKVRQADEHRPGKSKLTGEMKLRPSIELGAGPVWFLLALMSWRRSDVEENKRNIVSVAIERRDDGTGKKGEGPLALRSGLNPKTIRDYLAWLQVGESNTHSLKIVRITPNFGPGGVSGYDWDGDLTSVILRMAKPNLPAGAKIEHPLQLAARIVVAALVLSKMNRRKGRVSLTRRDLTATGLNFKVAVRELNWLLKNQFFVRVGSGQAALPELVEVGAYKAVPSPRFWDRNDVKKSSKREKISELRDHPENTETALRNPPDDPISVPRDPPDSALRGHPISQEGVTQEERDSVRSDTTLPLYPESKGLTSNTALPLFPTDSSADASPPPGEDGAAQLVRIAATMVADTEDLAFEAAVIGAVGDAAPQSWRRDNSARKSCCRHLLAFLVREGLDPDWALRAIREAAARLKANSDHFRDWTAVSAAVRRAVKIAAKLKQEASHGQASL